MKPLSSEPGAVERTLITTAAGVFTACFSERGLVRLEFPSEADSRRERDSTKEFSAAPSRWLAMTESALNRGLAGKTLRNFPPIDLRSGTTFQQSVWQMLCRIPPHQTMTYGEVAQAIGRPKATRAVGQACGANPIPVIIPCHRVLAAHGRLGGFSGGLDWKRKLLGLEGIKFSEAVQHID